MGWDFRTQRCTKKEIIKDCFANRCRLSKLELLKSSVQGNEVWSVWQREDGSRIIFLFLLSSSNGCYGVKEIEEIQGPRYYKCPMGFLEMVPAVNKEWRDKVYEYHDKRLRNLSALKKVKVGSVVTLDVEGNDFRVTRINPLQGVSLKNKCLYRLVKSRVIEVKEKTLVPFNLPVSIEQVGL